MGLFTQLGLLLEWKAACVSQRIYKIEAGLGHMSSRAGTFFGDASMRGNGPPNIEGMVTLKVDNVPYNTGVDELRRTFEKYGELGDVYMPRDLRSGEPRGFAFVRYMSQRDADDAIDRLDGEFFAGRELRIQYAKRRRPDFGGGGGYGGGHGGRYGGGQGGGGRYSGREDRYDDGHRRRRSRSRSRGRRSRSRSPRRRSRSRSRSRSHGRRGHRSRTRSPSLRRERRRRDSSVEDRGSRKGDDSGRRRRDSSVEDRGSRKGDDSGRRRRDPSIEDRGSGRGGGGGGSSRKDRDYDDKRDDDRRDDRRDNGRHHDSSHMNGNSKHRSDSEAGGRDR